MSEKFVSPVLGLSCEKGKKKGKEMKRKRGKEETRKGDQRYRSGDARKKENGGNKLC